MCYEHPTDVHGIRRSHLTMYMIRDMGGSELAARSENERAPSNENENENENEQPDIFRWVLTGENDKTKP